MIGAPVGAVPMRTCLARAARIAVRALAPRPAVVPAGLDDAHLLVGDLADVADPDLPGPRVGPETQRVPEAPREDLRPRRAERPGSISDRHESPHAVTLPRADERVRLRDAAVERDAQDLAVAAAVLGRVVGEAGAVEVGRHGRRLGPAPGVAARVADADVEVAVGPDVERAAVVVRRTAQAVDEHRLLGREHVVGTERPHDDAVLRRRVRLVRRVVEEEPPILAEPRVDGEAEEALLARRVDVEGAGDGERPAAGRAHEDGARLVDRDEPAVGQPAKIRQLAEADDEARVEREGLRRARVARARERVVRARTRAEDEEGEDEEASGRHGRASFPSGARLPRRRRGCPRCRAGLEARS